MLPAPQFWGIYGPVLHVVPAALPVSLESCLQYPCAPRPAQEKLWTAAACQRGSSQHRHAQWCWSMRSYDADAECAAVVYAALPQGVALPQQVVG